MSTDVLLPVDAAPPSAIGRGVDVVHVTRATAAGVRRHVIDLLTGLAELGVSQALLYTPEDADEAFWVGLERLQRVGVTARAVQMTRALSPSADWRAARELRRHLGELRPRVLHLHSSKAGGIGRLTALTMPGLPVVYSPHASAANLSRGYGVVELLLGRLRTDRIVAVSASERDELARWRPVSAGRLAQVDCGVEVAELRTAASGPPSVALPDGQVVVACGRLSHQKDPETLVRASAEIARSHPAVRFVWIGDGELRPNVEHAIATAGLADRWTITGWLANPYPLMRRASVFALPSRYESFGYVTLEAMLLGRPVVATRTTGTRDLVRHGGTGYLVDVGDVAGFADAIRRVLDDDVHAAELGARAAETGAGFTRARMAADMKSLYAQLS